MNKIIDELTTVRYSFVSNVQDVIQQSDFTCVHKIYFKCKRRPSMGVSNEYWFVNWRTILFCQKRKSIFLIRI